MQIVNNEYIGWQVDKKVIKGNREYNCSLFYFHILKDMQRKPF